MSVNERILDAQIAHMVWLERYKSSVASKVLAEINKADKEIYDALIEGLLSARGAAEVRKIKALGEKVAKTRSNTIDETYAYIVKELEDFGIYESDFQIRLIEKAALLEAAIRLDSPKKSEITNKVVEEAFRGRLLGEWFDDLKQSDAQRITDALRIGIADGQTNDEIVRRIVGSRSLKYTDGILNIARRDANAITRTAIAHVADASSQAVYEANTDIVLGVKWVSTLDSRTSPVCRERDGKIYEVKKAPPIPAHFGCRSRKVPYLGPSSIKGTRASAIGPVPDDMTYGQWLKKQPVEIQNEVLGVKKAQLFRKGGLPIDRFQDSSGREYTLDQLKQRDKKAWERAFG